ncbi:MAG: haloacid dehalogenase-like hydrolase [Nanoarchaeota archaeon]|nr:haloacid dehalogenase-like hydrolase [Nanoarchaeota archaeon]
MDKNEIIVGIDFDNTIVCYDSVFYDCALEKGVIPSTVSKTKNGVQDYLRQCGKENVWTELQGYVYGPGILNAKPFDGVLEFFKQCKNAGVKIYIISHKTKHPFIGEKHDLHFWALEWLRKNYFLDTEHNVVSQENIFLELTKEEKIARIKQLHCTHFIDDLPEIFDHLQFPRETHKILFDPQQKDDANDYIGLKSWGDIGTIITAHNFLTKKGIQCNSIKRISGGKNNQS